MISADIAKPDTAKVATTPNGLSSKELASIIRLTRQAIEKRSERENWPFEETPVRGGLKKLFPLRTLPLDIQKKVRIHFGEIPEELAECVPIDFDQAKVERCAKTWDVAFDWQKDLARKRLEVLEAWQAFRASFKGTMRGADMRFLEMFSNREVPSIDPVIYATVKKLKRSALHEWQQRFASQGITGLISQHGHNRGQTKVPLEQQSYILGVFNAIPNLKSGKIAKVLRGKFNGEAVSARSVREFLRRQRQANPQIFSFLENPDKWRNKHQLALGNASEIAEHFLHYIEMDSTIADVMCSDGKRYNLCAAIDVFSRKAKFLLTKTSSSWAIAGLLRAIIMDWGLPENVITDNGKDYTSQMIHEAMAALEIAVTLRRPFHPEEKPHVERVIKTISHGLFETLPGYCGHNVAERQAIENRKGFAAKFEHTPKYSIQVGLTPQELQEVINRWVEQDYHQDEHGGLGTSPNVKAASVPVRPRRIESARALDILLAPAPKSPHRTVLKKGVYLDSQRYWSDELIDYIGRRVNVRLDMRDAGRIFCFDPDTKAFICEALDLSISGIAVGDMIAAKKRARKRVLEGVKAMKTLAAEVGDPLAEEIRQIRESRATVTNLRVGTSAEDDNPFVDAANKAAAALDEKKAGEGKEMQGARLFEKSPSPCTSSAKTFNISGNEEVRDDTWASDDNHGQSEEVFAARAGLLRFVTKAEDQEVKLVFRNCRERFEWLKEAQRHRELTGEEIRWLLTYIDEWFEYADMFSEKWPETNRLWLGKIAPDHFPQYTIKEESK